MGQRMKVPKLRQAAVPQFGEIVGGALDGWEYTLKGGNVSKNKAVLMVSAHPPGWPFPIVAPTRLTRKDMTSLTYYLPEGDVHAPTPKIISVRRLLLNAIAAQGGAT